MNKNQKKTRWGAVILGAAVMMGMIFLSPVTKVDSLALVQAKVIPESAKIRAKADTNSDQLGSAEQGKNLDVISQTKGTDGKVWYKVYIDGQTTGYIRGDLVTANGTIPEESAASAQETKPAQSQESQSGTTTVSSGNKITVGSNNTQSSNTTETTQSAAETSATAANVAVNESKVIKAKVNSSSVRVRKGPGTNYDVAGNAPGNTEVSVSGETTDAEGKLWYQVSFNLNNATVNGFIRNDFLEILETMQEESVEEVPAEEEPVEEEEDLVTLENEDYFLKYMQNGEGQMDWFLFDNIKGTSQSLTALLQAAETNTEVDQADADMLSKLKLIVIVMAVVIFLLFIIMTVLLFKLRDASYEEEEEDEEEEDEEEEEPVVVKRGFRNRRKAVEEEEDEEEEPEEEEEEETPKRGLFGRRKAAIEEEEEVEAVVKNSKKAEPIAEEEETENTGSIDFMDVVDDDMVFDFIDNYKK